MTNQERIEWIRFQLEASLQPTVLKIKDDSSKHIGHAGSKQGGGHFVVEIASPAFEEKKLLECHRLIYDVLAEAIPAQIHALKIKILRN